MSLWYSIFVGGLHYRNLFFFSFWKCWNLFKHSSNIPKLYFPKVISYISHRPIQLDSSISHGEFSCQANSREKNHILLNLLFECFLLKIICFVHKCKVKSVKCNLKYKNKAVEDFFFFIFIILLFSHPFPSYA